MVSQRHTTTVQVLCDTEKTYAAYTYQQQVTLKCKLKEHTHIKMTRLKVTKLILQGTSADEDCSLPTITLPALKCWKKTRK